MAGKKDAGKFPARAGASGRQGKEHPGALLMRMYAAMADHFGPCNWWPGDSPFEVAVGAVLTQNTAWRYVEKALALLRAQKPAEVHKQRRFSAAVRPNEAGDGLAREVQRQPFKRRFLLVAKPEVSGSQHGVP